MIKNGADSPGTHLLTTQALGDGSFVAHNEGVRRSLQEQLETWQH